MRAWCVVYVAVLAGLHPSQSAKVKLPSWRGPDAFFDGTLPSNRSRHGFASVDGRIYVFGGQRGEMICAQYGEATQKMSHLQNTTFLCCLFRKNSYTQHSWKPENLNSRSQALKQELEALEISRGSLLKS
jgi:hypothetical protein